jgi:hypothetical protein
MIDDSERFQKIFKAFSCFRSIAAVGTSLLVKTKPPPTASSRDTFIHHVEVRLANSEYAR